ncbi:Kinetochore protein Spc24 [Cercospora zeina]
MVLFDEDPVELMAEATNKFHITPDKDSLTRVHESLNALHQARSLRLDNQTTILSTLSRKLNKVHSAHNYDVERHDAGQHAQNMLKMDTEKFRIAKGVNDAEIESERLSGELAALRQQLETLEREGVEGGRKADMAEDEIVLKLQFYRSLGIDARRDDASGDFKSAVISNSERGDVTVIDLKDERANVDAFWDAL